MSEHPPAPFVLRVGPLKVTVISNPDVRQSKSGNQYARVILGIVLKDRDEWWTKKLSGIAFEEKAVEMAMRVSSGSKALLWGDICSGGLDGDRDIGIRISGIVEVEPPKNGSQRHRPAYHEPTPSGFNEPNYRAPTTSTLGDAYPQPNPPQAGGGFDEDNIPF